MDIEKDRQGVKEKAVLLALHHDMALIRRELEIYGMKKDGTTLFVSRSEDYESLWKDALNILKNWFERKI